MTQDKAQAAGAVSIDGPEFRAELNAFQAARGTEPYHTRRASLIAHIDAKLAQHGQERYEAGVDFQYKVSENRVKHLTRERDIARQAASHEDRRAEAAKASLARLVEAISHGVPLEEPVSVCKAMMAQCPATVVLDSGTGPKAAVHLVNIGVTGWVHTKETATAYADGFNLGKDWLRAAIRDYADKSVAALLPAKAETPKCWSCKKSYTTEQRTDADGNCPHCGVEIDIEDVTPAPAMGEELPPLPAPLEIEWPSLNSHALGCGVEDRNIRDRYDAANYGFEEGVDSAASRVPDAVYDADQMRDYGRACMVLRQPGAQELVSLQSAAIESHCKSRNEDAATIAELRKALAELRELHISTLRAPTHFNAYTDIIDKALATAPVSQPAAQVKSKLPQGVTLRAFQAADDKSWWISIKHPFGTTNLLCEQIRDLQLAHLLTAPAPLSAPAGSEQEKNAARQAIEAKAEEIYSAWPQAAEYPWQAGGNSHKQEEARDLARAALAAQKEQSK